MNNLLRTKSISIKNLTIIIFAFSIFLITGLMTIIVFTGWTSSNNKHAKAMATDLNKIATDKIDHFMDKELILTTADSIYSGDKKFILNSSISFSDLNEHLEEIVKANRGAVLIIDQNNGDMIANSLNYDNLRAVEQEYPFIQEALEQYRATEDNDIFYKGKKDSYFLNFQSYQTNGLNLILISTIPRSFLMKDIINNMKITLMVVVIAVIIVLSVHYILKKKLGKVFFKIVQTTEELSSGNLSQRVSVYRNDELGKLSASINKMADTINELVNNLEMTVQERTAKLEYISYHDSLTGLLNRGCFEQTLKKEEISENLPLSIIFADLDGLKMTNDIFGHDAGDALIMKFVDIIKSSCMNDKAFAARLGGDEFVIALPNTEEQAARKILQQIKDDFSKTHVTAIKNSISIGCATKLNSMEKVEDTIARAESNMYKHKTMNHSRFNSDVINTIIKEIHERSPNEREHSMSVSMLCKRIGQSLKLPETDIKRLEQAGYLHDIGKIVLEPGILLKKTLSTVEIKAMQQHSVIGYRILNLFDDTLDLAEGVYSHHENWDGTGYPKKLKGEEIPIYARIIAIAEIYDFMTNGYNSVIRNKDEALEEIKLLAGTKLDPEIVEVFLKMMRA